RAKLSEVKAELRRRLHLPIPEQGRWLASVVRGHCNYYGVPGNSDAINAFRDQATRHWYWALKRRSQRHRLNWERMHRIAKRWLPPPTSRTRTLSSASTPTPKGAAQCGSSAR